MQVTLSIRTFRLICLAAMLTPGLSLSPCAAAQSDPGWTLEATQVDPASYAGITLANGMIGILSAPQPFRTTQTLLAGAYASRGPGEVHKILTSFSFLDLDLHVDGVQVDQLTEVRNFRQALDMRRAVFTTSFDYADKLDVRYTLRALRQMPHTAMVEVTLSARKAVAISARSRLEPSQMIEQVERLESDLPLDHASPVRRKFFAARGTAVGGKLEVAAAQTIAFDAAPGAAPEVRRGPDGLRFNRTLDAGTSFRFAIVGSTISSAQSSDVLNAARRLTLAALLQGPDELVAGHERAWADLWKSDIVIEGDDAAQRDVRSMLYHLYSFAREGSGYSIAPMGLSRDGYNGHIFWDAELWMFPPLLVLRPELAREMLDYRFARLEAAERNARAFGYRGALFPWESIETGEEDTPLEALSGILQHHISADVGIAAWNYYRVTRDRAWLRERGFPLIRATADFWASRVTRTGPGRYDIRGVMGADEFAVRVDNNAFTNGAAIANLEAATKAAKVLGVAPDPGWEEVRRNIPILRFPDGVTREHASYDGEVIKQADVNLLAFPLGLVSDPAAVRRDLDYYASRISPHGPAMTRSILAILYQRLGMAAEALAMYRQGYVPNQHPPFGVLTETARSANPYFATGAGGNLQTMLFGFGGLDITDRGIVQRSSTLPPGWRSLTMTGVGPEKRSYSVR
ncbi:MAG TPA: hypothetical protein VJQ52_21815 [Steroidobacteraceae bacterium]|nr:hypothetical protein [Steroidobacteraceae bacterium]